MTTNRLRRELEALKNLRDCPGCGYPSYTNVEYNIVERVHRVGDPPPEPDPPEYCKVCGREERVIVVKVRGLDEKPRA